MSHATTVLLVLCPKCGGMMKLIADENGKWKYKCMSCGYEMVAHAKVSINKVEYGTA